MSIFAVLAAVSCTDGMTWTDDDRRMISLNAVIDDVPVRSILPADEIEDKLTDITIAAYDENGALVDVQYYTDLSDLRLYVSKSGDNDLFALANMGDMTSEMPSDLEDVADVSYVIESFSEVGRKGIPMCGTLKASVSAHDPEIRLVRLFAKVNLRILHTSLDNSSSINPYAFNLCNRSLYVRQANRRLFPFAPSGSRALYESDIMAESDYNPDLNDKTVHSDKSLLGPGPGYWQDTTVVMYVPENIQGVLLPANEDPLAKVEERISDLNGRDYSGLCTYVELNAWKEGLGSGLSGGITYRFYLGADNVTDFSVERNGRYDVTLDLTQESFGIDSWKVVKGDDWSDTRSLEFIGDSYVIYPGTTRDVFVHYSALKGVGHDSQAKPSEWVYSFDDAGMSAAGITYTCNPSVLKPSPASANDICFSFTASSTAEVGAAFPLTVSLKDGSHTRHSLIYVAEPGDLTPVWEGMPLYVAQYGIVTLDGVSDLSLPVTVSVSDPSLIECTEIDDDTFKVTALRPGEVDITFTGNGGTQTCSTRLKISAPLLDVTTGAVAMNPDGAPVMLDYSYLDVRGERLSGFDEEAFRKYLLPTVSDNEYFTTSVTSDKVTVMVGQLYDAEGKLINTGSAYDLTLKAADCAGSGSQKLQAYVIDPFDDIVQKHYGRIDDYTLFSLDGVDERLREHFAAAMLANASFDYEAPSPHADKAYVRAGLEPVWKGNFSNANETYAISFDPDDERYSTGASFLVRQCAVASDTRHSAGLHEVVLYVVNRHSGEKIGHVCGHVGIYVHTALGARAEFGSQTCNYKPAGSEASVPCFADVYNQIAGSLKFSPESGSRIYYMDVSAEFVTDVSRTFVYERLLVGARTGSNAYDATSVLLPKVSDGQTDANTRLLYSVDGSGGYRLLVAGEDYGVRKGVGIMLYRALRLQTYDYTPSRSDLNNWFLGLSVNNVANSVFSPCYDVHDLLKSKDMNLNKVSRNLPYHFAPSDHPDKVDDDGKGYHVIHFLEEVAPETGGWINLL